LIEENIEEL